ncbi:sensor histidine kinase [Ralstonia pseudosolanacearum]|uniref:sensor histidine kinase n=1 Tax=Ralstonia pseudosolanacearum TaxID=1310165 RepID=UPI0018665953|nr:sensor histidine kinase [Ralstonia pseudosolanacearum]QOK92963.1 sensor histidine kinase [Ralstonia pseudosolanacearum]
MRHGTERLMAGAAPEGMASPSAVHHLPMSESDFPFSSASPRRGFGWLVAAGLVAVMALVCATTFVVTWNRGLSQAQQAAGARVDRYAANLKSTLDRYEYLPALVALHPFIHDLLAHPTPDNVARANRYLREVTDRARATATYVIAPTGLALAASNYNLPDSFVGAEYLFRPYFQQAAAGHVGRFYGIGITREEPGYYISQPVMQNGSVIGVTVVKLNLEWFGRASHDASEPVMVADENGVIFLSSVPAWQYRTVEPLTPELQAQLEATRQYFRKQITPLPLQPEMPAFLKLVGRMPDGARLVRVGDRINAPRYLLVSRELVEPDWQLMYLTPIDPVMGAARSATIAAAFAFAFVCLLLFYWRQRRLRLREVLRGRHLLEAAYDQLERRVEDRTADLMATNEQLQHEIVDRTRAEAELRATQDELVQASKLAALGQMAAGITHELNQPLAALRTFSDNTRILLERGQHGAAADNLRAIADLTERMGKITAQLKLFAGRSRRRHADVQVRVALDHVLALLRPRLAEVETALHWRLPEAACVVRADELKLEQVLINLIGNALDAIAANDLSRPGRIDIDIGPADGAPAQLCIVVRDNGPGIAADAMPHLFEPFFTTKEIGQGLGLGLAISTSIARDFGGSLSAANVPGGGAQFTLSLVRAEVVPAATS